MVPRHPIGKETTYKTQHDFILIAFGSAGAPHTIKTERYCDNFAKYGQANSGENSAFGELEPEIKNPACEAGVSLALGLRSDATVRVFHDQIVR